MATSPTSRLRLAAFGGVTGPVAFIAAWAVGAATTDRQYSSIDDAISRLAAVGADSRPLMTTGFIAFGASVPAFAVALRRAVDGPAWIAALATGVATLAVAAAPLDHSDFVDRLHGLFAGIGYVTLAAAPLLAARPLMRGGHSTLARLGIASGIVAAVSLALTLTGLPTGFFQRLGLGAGDVWLATCGVAIALGRLSPAPSPPGD